MSFRRIYAYSQGNFIPRRENRNDFELQQCLLSRQTLHVFGVSRMGDALLRMNQCFEGTLTEQSVGPKSRKDQSYLMSVHFRRINKIPFHERQITCHKKAQRCISKENESKYIMCANECACWHCIISLYRMH